MLLQQRLRVVVQLARRGAVLRMVEDGGEASLQLPRREEERPVDERHHVFEPHVVQQTRAGEDGVAIASCRQSSRRRLAFAASHVSSGRRRTAPCCSRSAILLGAVRAVERRPLRVGFSRLETTSTARDASSTCTTGWLYSGAIFTAVCGLLVVAPPISSGRVMPRRSISRATKTISSSDGVMSPLRPIMSACLVDRGLQDLRGRHHDAEIDDLVVVAAEDDADDVLADVVDVAFHGRHDDLALRPADVAAAARFSSSMYGSR